jgi:acetyl esterase/lipase
MSASPQVSFLLVTRIRRSIALLALCTAFAAPGTAVAAQAELNSAEPCSTFAALYGLLPFLMWIGLIPKPSMSSTAAPNDTSTSIVIHPDKSDQITCGKTAVQTIDDVVFAARKMPNGKSLDLLMDIQIPQTPGGKKPLVVFVTGGGFARAPKESALNLRTYVAESGFVVASIQYRTARNGAIYRDGIADVKSAIRHLRKDADRYQIDPRKVAVWGQSAGGYLAAMVGVTNGSKTFEIGTDLDQSSDVQAVVDQFGPSDISRIAEGFDPHMNEAVLAADSPVAQYVGMAHATSVLDTRIATTAANPLTYVKPTAPPFLLFHGSQDRLVSPSQTLILHNALIAIGAHSARYVLDGAAHGDQSFMGDRESGLPWSTKQTMNVIVDFLKLSIGARE